MPNVASVSASYILGKIRRREAELLRPAGSRVFVKKRRSKRTLPKPVPTTKRGMPRRAPGGGSFRAYISQKCKGIAKACFRQLGEEYRALSCEERARFKVMGAEATVVHRQGGDAFGKTARELARLVLRREAQGRAQLLDTNATVPVLTPYPFAASLPKSWPWL